MSDLISTQESVTKIVDAAIRKILSGEQKLTKEYEQSIKDAVNVILNTARKTDGDLIRRQDAIDAINALHEKPNAWLDSAVDAVMTLPSAQPEIIRCKDCKYGDTFHEFDDPEMPMKCIGHHYGGTYPDDFCSYAERRTDEGD